MNAYLSKSLKLAGMFFLTMFFTIVASVFVVLPAVTQLAGISFAISPVQWVPLKDSSLGDGLTTGALVPYLFNGATFDRLPGDSVNGANVQLPGGTIASADAVTNSGAITPSLSFRMVFNGTTWDRIRDFTNFVDPTVTPTGIQNVGNIHFQRNFSTTDFRRWLGQNGVHATMNIQSGSAFNESQTGASDTAVVTSIAAGTSQQSHIFKVSASCSATGTSGITIADGGGTIWQTGTAAVGQVDFDLTFPNAIVGDQGTTVTVTLATCGPASAGTLNVQGNRY